jgi:predicted dehydrogenase
MKRRDFIRNSACLAGAITLPTIIPASALGKNGFTSPSNRLLMGFIGTGTRGMRNLRSFIEKREIQIVAVCDVDSSHVARARQEAWDHHQNKDCRAYEDYRELLDKEQLDTVTISTPDHWHMLQYIAAAEKKIDIFGEKPLVRKIEEGKKVVKACTENDIIWQTGSWQRSRADFRTACELVANGVLGKIQKIDVGLPELKKEIGIPEIQEPPPEVNYDFWLGPAPYKPYRGILHWDWRWQMDYSGGQLTDWCGHHVDIAFWSMLDQVAPVEIEGEATFREGSLYDVPYTFDIDMKLSNGLPMRIVNSSKLPHGSGTYWYGENGWIFVTRGKLLASDENLLNEKIPENGIRLYKSDDHYQNFIDCVKSRKPAITPVDAANRAITAGLLGEIAFLTCEKLTWDPVKEKLIKPSKEAKELLSRDYRKPWKF